MATGAEKRGTQRSQDAGISLAIGRIARIAICAGIEDADAGIGEALTEGMGIDAAVNDCRLARGG